MPNKNLFATVLTYAAPSSNYRGESEENRTVLQKIAKGAKEHTVISPESMRNALREMLIEAGLPSNRKRLHDQDQLAVEFKEFPNASKFADDFLFGFMVADNDAIKKNKGMLPKRDSILRMNMAVAVTPYRFDATFHQSPMNAGSSPWKNSAKSALLHRKPLLKAIGELSNVAGGHARSYYEMAPKSIIARLTPCLVAGFNTYGFDENGNFNELSRLHSEDLPAEEFWIGGEIIRNMKAEHKAVRKSPKVDN
ncbi:MAG: type I-B CRISPR-associated protein Cas7/Cst2/DevR [Oscillatoriales cyanobacterium]|nr:MAG: type I-B CRISPR-associated protein Cas7/Cst2/DevR [Oscillatoriales cyanobacterium]